LSEDLLRLLLIGPDLFEKGHKPTAILADKAVFLLESIQVAP
jgi:hypothetical protein